MTAAQSRLAGMSLTIAGLCRTTFFIAARYDAHINVEVVGSYGVISYLFKYVYKGADRADVEVEVSTAL